MPDRDEHVREFQRATADFVSAQIAFTNAVLAARKAGISDQELAGVTGIRAGDFGFNCTLQGVVSRRTDSARSLSMRAMRRACRSISRARAGSRALYRGNAASRNLGEARDHN